MCGRRAELLAEAQLRYALVGVDSDVLSESIRPLMAVGAPHGTNLSLILQLAEDVIAEANMLGGLERPGMLGKTDRGLTIASDRGRTSHGVS